MAVRINQDAILKYADKAFLGLAAAFLLITAIVTMTTSGNPPITYKQVEDDFKVKSQQQKSLLSDSANRDKDLMLLLGITEMDKASPEDLAVYRLLQGNPPYAQTFQ